MAKLKPIRLAIDKSLTGPYDRLLRRPGTEVESLGSGAYTVIIRGTRLTEALPLWGAETACYYGKSKLRRGWSAEDFKQEQEAVNWQPSQQVKILAVPFGYFKLPNANWVSELAAELTPWKAGVVAGWQKSIEKDIWLTILRLYHFSPVYPESLKSRGFHLRVNPFHVDGLQVILPEKVFHERVNLVQMAVERNTNN